MTLPGATFARRACIAVAIATLAALLLALLWAATDVLLLLFAAILVACFFRGTANLFRPGDARAGGVGTCEASCFSLPASSRPRDEDVFTSITGVKGTTPLRRWAASSSSAR